MKLRWIWLVPAVVAVAWTLSRGSPQATPRASLSVPAFVTLEGLPETGTTDVVLRGPGSASQLQVLGRVVHEPSSARRGRLWLRDGRRVALVVVQDAGASRRSSFNSALHRVENGQSARLVGALMDASNAMVTEHGSVVVQRGADGEPPDESDGRRVLRERVDRLSIDVVDLATGQSRAAWSGTGQIAFLATPLRGDEIAVYHVDATGARLVGLDVSSGRSWSITRTIPPLARDFSYDAARDAIVFARAAAPGSSDYEVVRVAAHGGPFEPVAIVRDPSDHLMPRVLRDGRIAFTPADARGLALTMPTAGSAVDRLAPLGDGIDTALADTGNGAFLAVRHRTRTTESLAIVERASAHATSISVPDRLTEFVGFIEGDPR